MDVAIKSDKKVDSWWSSTLDLMSYQQLNVVGSVVVLGGYLSCVQTGTNLFSFLLIRNNFIGNMKLQEGEGPQGDL